jgi:hypothetical protein
MTRPTKVLFRRIGLGAPRRVVAVIAFLTLSAGLLALPAFADPLTPAEMMGLDLSGTGLGASPYAFVDLGSASTGGNWNTGPVAGSVLIGQSAAISLSGGDNGGLTNGGILYYDSTANISGSLQNPPPTMEVSTSVTQTQLTAAQNVAAYATSIGNAATCTALGNCELQSFINVPSTQTFAASNTLNVIDITGSGNSFHNVALTFMASADDYFVINVNPGNVQTNVSMMLDGVLATHILWNLTGSGSVFNTSGSPTLYGTFLSTGGGTINFDGATLDGQLININGSGLQFVSNANIPNFEPFTVPAPMIGHGLPVVLAVGGVLFGFKLWEHNHKRRSLATAIPHAAT